MYAYQPMQNSTRLLIALWIFFLLLGLVVTGKSFGNTTVTVEPVVLEIEQVTAVPEEALVVNIEEPEDTPYSHDQLRLLRLAHDIGTEVGWPETIQAILLQETSAGVHGPVGDRSHSFGQRSYCHMQVKLAAAKDVLRYYDLGRVFATEEELLVALLTEDEFCIQVGAHYFALMVERTPTWSEAVIAYNQGIAGSQLYGDRGGYLPKIRSRIHSEIRPYGALLGYESVQVAMN